MILGWLICQRMKSLKRFGDQAPSEEYIINAYQQFVANIRTKYPEANIVCSLGSMDAAKKDQNG